MVIGIFIWIVCGIIAIMIAKRKGRSKLGWFFGGVILGPVGLIIIALLPKKTGEKRKNRKLEQKVIGALNKRKEEESKKYEIAQLKKRTEELKKEKKMPLSSSDKPMQKVGVKSGMVTFLYLLSGVLIFGGAIAVFDCFKISENMLQFQFTKILQFSVGFGSIFTGVIMLGFAAVAGEIKELRKEEEGQDVIEQRARIIQLLNEIKKERG